jgi:hypothetical protein
MITRRFQAVRLSLLAAPMLLLTPLTGAPVCQADGEGFQRVCAWAAYDAGEHGLGEDPDGYVGAAFDGRYAYFAPYDNGSEFHGEVLRYDTLGAFADLASWAAFDAGDHGVGNDPDGFWGAVFDGRYVYFVPFDNGTNYHGEVLRYDTLGDFADVSAWGAFDPGDHGVGDDPDGYIEGAFDGRYIYFAPYHNGTTHHGEVLRLDTTGDFASASSWTTYDAGAHGVGEKYGYAGVVFDGRYVYFVPNCTAHTAHHGEVRRYDTTGEFTDASSWAAYDAGVHGVGNDPDGYVGAVFDGRYVYFVPYYDDPIQHGEMLRYDTTSDFVSTASWAAFDPGGSGVGTDADGYIGAVFDGRYVYFVPCHNGSYYHSEVLRYDTGGVFDDVAAWDTFDPSTHGVTNGRGGYQHAIFDGRHVYFVPNRWGWPHGEVLRFDTAISPGDLNCDDCVDQADLGILLADWGCTGGDCPGDCDNDGDTDHSDLGILLAHWGEGCP